MKDQTLVIEGFRCEHLNLDFTCSRALALAVDQRVFGRHQLLVATAERAGRFIGLAHCGMPDPPEAGLLACLDLLRSDGTAAAVAYSDEPVKDGPVSSELALRFFSARAAAADQGVHLLDWMICDGKMIRSLKFGLIAGATWWDVP
jgi:hypothetical protein